MASARAREPFREMNNSRRFVASENQRERRPANRVLGRGKVDDPVPSNDNDQEIAELERLNAKLSDSLKRCRLILADCQSKLASNSNAPDAEAGELSG